MKILIVSNSLQKAGKEKQIFLLTKGLDQRKINYKIILRKDQIEFPLDSDKIWILNSHKILQQIQELRSLIKKYNPDIIHSWEGYMSTITRVASIFTHCKYIDGSIRFSRKFSWKNSIRFRTWIINKLSDRTVANTRTGLQSFNFKENKKNRVVPNGFNFHEIASHKKNHIRENKYIIGMVASFSRAKDFPTLINSAMKIIDENQHIIFKLIGDGPFLEKYKKSVPRKYRSNIIFTGKIDNPISIIQEFNIGVLLSKKNHSEGMSNSIMEYMAMKIPVIATNTGGNTELVDDGKTGYLIDFEDEITLNNKIVFLLNNKNIAEQMGKEGYEKLKKNHQLNVYVNNWINIYKELLD